MDTNDTEISYLTSEADMTAVYDQSNLTTGHTSRYTKNGFLVDGPRLQGYIPTPGKGRGKASWVW